MPATSPRPTSSPRLRIILIEDQTLVAEGIVAVLRQAEGIEVAKVFPSASAALADESIRHGVDVALVDFHLGSKEEEKLLRQLRDRLSTTRWIWLSGAVTTASLLQIDEMRFQGFVHKDDPSSHLLDAVYAAMAGNVYQSPTARALLEKLARAPVCVPKILSPREQEVLALVGEGMTNEDIGAILGLSATTVQTHRRNIMGKLDLHTSGALQAYAQQGGFTASSNATGATRPPPTPAPAPGRKHET